MTRRSALPPAPDLRADWQKAQGERCGCLGTDDMCPCQNENPWPRPYIDWQARAFKAEACLREIAEGDHRIISGSPGPLFDMGWSGCGKALADKARSALSASPESGSTGVWPNQSPTPLSKTEVQS